MVDSLPAAGAGPPAFRAFRGEEKPTMTYRPALALLLAALAPAAALRWGSAPGGTRRNRAASPPASRSARRASRRPGRTPPWSARRRRRTGCSGGSAGAPAPTPGRSPRVGARCGGRCAGRWLSARRRRRWGSSRSLICAGLLVCVTEAPLLAQSTADRTEFAVGGGFHVSPDITDFIQLPAVPTVNVRVTRWLNDRWGITGNVIAGVGSGGRKLDRGVHDRLAAQAERAGISEPVYLKDPTYIQFLIRYRMRMRRLSGEEAGHLYFRYRCRRCGGQRTHQQPRRPYSRECGAVGKGLGEAPPEPGGVRVMGSDR